ncbi:MAG: AMIN-like domain-containing (lipo)protein [Candidatus Dormibacteria bacterium]
MTEFDEDLRRHLAREADSVQGMPRALRTRIADSSGPRAALWLRLTPVAVVVLFVAVAGLLMRQVRPASPTGGAAAIVSASPTATTSPGPSPEPSPAAPTSPASVLGPFVCGAGGTGGTTGATGDLKAVRVAHQAGFDRVTYEFAGNGIPQFSISRQSGTRFTQDASGMPVDVRGNNAMKVVFHGASQRDVNGNPTYSGSSDIVLAPSPGSANAIAEVRQVGDFERVLSWAVGLSARPACSRVVELGSPSRLVIDLQPQS